MWSDDEEELLDGVEDDEEPPVWSSTTRFIVAVILAAVMASYVYLFPTLFDALLGWTQSDTLIGNTVTSGNITVSFTEAVQEDLQGLYGEFPEEETALCLYGRRENATYYVNDVTQPTVYSSSYSHVRHAPCPPTTLIVFHTHPQRQCLPSGTDRESLRDVQERNDDTIMLIMCAPSEFTVVHDPDAAI